MHDIYIYEIDTRRSKDHVLGYHVHMIFFMFFRKKEFITPYNLFIAITIVPNSSNQ